MGSIPISSTMVTSGNAGYLCVLGGVRNAAGSQTVFSRINASAAPLIVDTVSVVSLAWVYSRTADCRYSRPAFIFLNDSIS